MKITLFAVLAAASTLPLGAQIDPTQAEDPAQKMREIMNQVAQEMTEIDDLLQKTSRSKKAATAGMKESIRGLEKALDSVGKSQRQVVQGIDALLDQAEKLKKSGC